MEITYYGAGCLYVSIKQTNILINPDIESAGLKLPKLKTDVVLYTLQNDDRLSSKDILSIDWPGEYETNNILITGIAAQLHTDEADKPQRAVMYTITSDVTKILITGDIAPELNEKQLEAIGTVQVLALPVGGHGLTLDATASAALVSRLGPQMFYRCITQDGVTKYQVPQDKVDVFLGEVGSENPETVDKLKIKASDEANEETKVVLLKRQT